jgi:hypothetical protein
MIPVFGQGKIKSLFNLRDGSSYINETTYSHMGQLMEVGEVFVSSHEFSMAKSYSVSFKMQDSKLETVELRTNASKLDKAINDVYVIALARGYVK